LEFLKQNLNAGIMETVGGLLEFRMVNGIATWRNANGELHRDDISPAIIHLDRREEYYYFGKLYMIRYPDGTRYIVNTQLFSNLSKGMN
jgi:hypothetical protein